MGKQRKKTLQELMQDRATGTGNPENLKEHKGTHMTLAAAMIDGLIKFFDLIQVEDD